MKKIQKALSGLLAGLMLFTSVPVSALPSIVSDSSTESIINTEEENSPEIETNAISTNETAETDFNNTEETLDSSEETEGPTIETPIIEDKPTVFLDSEEDLEETDNWELSVVFYDSSVENGTKPLTEINWNANMWNEEKDITVQLNYKNTNVSRDYAPGELKIEINSRPQTRGGYYTESAISAGSLDNGYDWNYKDNKKQGVILTNNIPIKASENFEGSLQFKYSIGPDSFANDSHQNISATLYSSDNTELAKSNEITFNFTSTKKNHTVSASTSKIAGYDGLPTNASDYIWVKYTLNCDSTSASSQGGIRGVWDGNNHAYYNFRFGVPILENTIILNSQLETPEIQDNVAFFEKDSKRSWTYGYQLTTTIFVGYLKSEYSGEVVSQVINAYGTYEDETEESFLGTSTQNIDLTKYEFTYSGNLYSISKGTSYNDNRISAYIQNELQKNNSTGYTITPKAIYTGEKMDVVIGDDILFAPDSNNEYKKLNDDDYYFDSISYSGSGFKNANGAQIDAYDAELWVRYAGESEYEKYGDTLIANKDYKISFTNKNIVGWKIIIKDMNESLATSQILTYLCLTKRGIGTTGYLYNFAYLQIYINNILQNEPSLDSYDSISTKMDIATFDQNTYGTYMQRAVGSIPIIDNAIIFDFYKYAGGGFSNGSSSTMTDIPSKEKFVGDYTFCAEFSTNCGSTQNFKGVILYDILPEGMDIEDFEILTNTNSYYGTKTQSGVTIDYDYLKNHITISTQENYKRTNKTYVKITYDFSDDPINLDTFEGLAGVGSYHIFLLPKIKMTVSVSYDNYEEFGNSYFNKAYMDIIDKENIDYIPWNSNYESWTNSWWSSKDTTDINENNDTSEWLLHGYGTLKIIKASASHQNVQTQASSTISNYSIDLTQAEYGKDYSYKLKVQTGENKATNLIIYNNLEKWAKDKDGNFVEAAGNKNYWQGEFQGVDTSYAESKGYTVKVWYSENEKAGTLTEDTSWKEYSESVDKTKVKSLAFQYLNADGTSAILPENNLTYVIVKMKAPDDESIKTLAYNGCWTQWNAIDKNDEIIDFIVGINSNIVKVALPNSVLNDSIPSIELDITKEIQGTNEAFENLKLDPNAEYNFQITLEKQEANEDGSHDIVHGLLSNKKGLIIKGLTVGSWLISEADDNYFDFVDIVSTMDPSLAVEGVTFEKTDAGYLLTITEDLNPDIDTIYSLKVINKIEPESYYEEKDEKVNLFNGTPVVEQ